MRVTTQGEYGVRCLRWLARNATDGRPISVSTLAGRENLPKDYVEQILMKLRRAGLVKSIRGVSGGYLLSVPPSKITLTQIIRALEGDVFEVVCDRLHRKTKECVNENDCGMRPVWYRLKKTIERFLDQVTLADISESEEKAKEALERVAP